MILYRYFIVRRPLDPFPHEENTVRRPCAEPRPGPSSATRRRPAFSTAHISFLDYYLSFPSSNCRRTGATRRWPAAAAAVARVAPAAAAIRTTIAVAAKRTSTRAGQSRPPNTWTTNRRRRKSRPPRRRPRIACP